MLLTSLAVGLGLTIAPLPQFIPGELNPYGAGCKGTGQAPAGIVVPLAQRTAMGNSQNVFPHGRANMRYQQVFLSSEIQNPNVLLGYELRQNDIVIGHAAGTSTLTVMLGYTSKDHQTLTNNYAGNADQGALTTVLNAVPVSFPALSGVNTDPTKFAVQIMFTSPFPFTPSSTQNLLMEILNTSTASHASYWDADGSTTTARVYGSPSNAATGTVALGYGLVMKLVTPGGGGAVPTFGSPDKPVIGTPYTLNVAYARPNSAAAVLLGASDTKWLSLTLPFDFGAAAPGCKLLASGEYMFPLTTTASGTASLTLNVPNDKSLIQLVYFHQTVIADLPANPAGLVFTQGLRAKVGGLP